MTALLTVFVPNTDQGLCWWACAESIERTNGHNRELIQEVIASGCMDASIPSVEKFLQIDLVPTLNQALELTDNGTHVIATIKEARGLHAVVLIDRNKSNVVYWNPNRPERYLQMPYKELAAKWSFGTTLK